MQNDVDAHEMLWMVSPMCSAVDHLPSEYVYAFPLWSTAIQNDFDAHEMLWMASPMCSAFDHLPSEYVYALPLWSTAIQNDDDAHEIPVRTAGALGAPISAPVDQVPPL